MRFCREDIKKDMDAFLSYPRMFVLLLNLMCFEVIEVRAYSLPVNRDGGLYETA